MTGGQGGHIAVTAAEAEEWTARVAAAPRVSAGDLAVSFAPARVTGVRQYVEGRRFFPPILEDIKAAHSSIHINQYGIKPGDVADGFVPVLREKARQGITVRLIVDQRGSAIDGVSRRMFRGLTEAGVQVVCNYGVIPGRGGLLDARPPGPWRPDQLGHIDHRKLFVLDGRVAWLGGAGIEDHFQDGRFHDLFVRVEGEAVAQLQAVFLTSFAYFGGSLPHGLDALHSHFPAPADPGPVFVRVLHNVPAADHLPVTPAFARLLEQARRRLEIMNPFIADHGMIRRILAAARRGVAVRMVVPGRPRDWIGLGVLQTYAPALLDAGVQISCYPAMVHAKVMVADDAVLAGTCNLDAWALYRNWELDLLVDDAAIAESFRADPFDADIAASEPLQIPSDGFLRLRNRAVAAVSPFL